MPRRNDGFTLIETLVALTVFAGVFAALTAGLQGGSRGLRLARMEQGAIMLAKAKLATAGLDVPLADGQAFAGIEDDLSWTVGVQQRVATDDEQRDPVLKAYWVVVDVSWRDGPLQQLRATQLKGLKLEGAPR